MAREPGYYFFPGDYARDCAHLTLMEDGVYRRLLDHYYSRGKPLPAEFDRLERISRAVSPDEKLAVVAVAEEFFPISSDGLRHNHRADREIEARKAYLAEQLRKSLLGVQARQKYNPEDDPRVDPEVHPEDNPSLSSSSSSSCTSSSTHPCPTAPPSGVRRSVQDRKDPKYSVGFLTFWEKYPRRIGKGRAWRAWKTHVRAEDITEILAALGWQTESDDWTREGGRFIPHPATYINGRRWEDERPANNGEPF